MKYLLKKKDVIYLSIILLLIIILLYTEKSRFKPIIERFHFSNNSITYQNNNSLSIINNCENKILKTISKDSIAIIGHVYSWEGDESFINSRVIKFLENNKDNLNMVIFSGDLFRVPSLSKWADLKKLMENLNLPFYISPGNHDVEFGDNSLRDTFNLSFDYNFPIIIQHNQTNIQLDDSTKIKGRIANNLILNLKEDKNIIIRHHSPIKEFFDIANSVQPLELHSIKELNSELDTKTTFIVGDFGIHNKYFCYEFDKIKVIGSGISGNGKEEALILNKNKLYRHIF
jgi:hypothetical protein